MTDPTPNGQTWACRAPLGLPSLRGRCESTDDLAQKGHFGYGCGPVPPAPSSDTPSDERHAWKRSGPWDHTVGPDRCICGKGWPCPDAPAHPTPSPVPEASGRPKWEPLTLREAAIEAILIREQDTAFSTVARIIAALPAHSSSPVPEASGRAVARVRAWLDLDAATEGRAAPDDRLLPLSYQSAPLTYGDLRALASSSSPVGDRGLDELRDALAGLDAMTSGEIMAHHEHPSKPVVDAARALLAAADREDRR